MKATLPGFSILVTFTIQLLIFNLNPSTAFAQIPTVQDCMGAIPVCQDIYIEENSYSGDGNYNNEIYNPGGECQNDCPGSCLDGEQNSVWYIFTVQAAGILRLTIDPFGTGDDYDWAVYDITQLRCSDIYSSYALMQKSCSAYGQAPNGNTGISTPNGGNSNCSVCGASNLWNKDLAVTQGRTYVLVVENWSGTTEGYTLDFSASTAVIYDDVRPEIATVLSDQISCGDTEIIVDFSENVVCESVQPTDFQLAGPGGPYTILDAQGEVCLAGGEMEKRYTLIIDKPIRNDGDYSVQLMPLNFIYDACNNFALGNTITFNVDLGAPVINEFNIEIDEATCGLSNGSITGLLVLGTPPYELLWTNEFGDPFGTDLDLLDVPTGNYFLSVTDENTCQTIGGPYNVGQTGAPLVNDDLLAITGADWGANNGHITGLQIEGNEPLTYLWTDESNNPVGSEIDLHDIYAGNYYLLVTDIYGCDTLAGPYFVQQIGGPLGVQAVADPGAICAGEASQLHATAYGGTGEYSYVWASNPPGFNSDIQSPLVYPLVTTSYTVSINDGYNVTSSSATVTVNPIPVSNAGDDQTINYGTSTTIYGTAGGGGGVYTYSWEPADLLINPTAQNPATKRLYQTTLFTLRATDLSSGCISDNDTVIVSLSGGPLGVTASASQDTICKGEIATITAYGFGGNFGTYTYTWYLGTDELKVETNDISTLDVSPSIVGNHTYTVKIFDGFNEFTTDVTIHVALSPSFLIQAPPYIIQGDQIIACPADTVELRPSNLYTNSQYYWSNGSTAPYINLATTGIGFSVRNISLTITNLDGCSFTDSVTVIFDFAACFGIEEYSTFPEVKVFPNPTTGILNIELEECEGFNSIQILNMQGSVIYEKDLNKACQGGTLLKADLSAFPKGVYLVRAIHERFIYHQKVTLN